jgi:hypothetical protein
VLDLAAVPAGHLASLRQQAEAHARGYSLLSWEGPVPDEHLAAVTTVISAAMSDIPRDEGHQPWLWDAELGFGILDRWASFEIGAAQALAT